MTLPTFIGIGVQRGGTTWLHTLLSSHPDVYMPGLRKEIRFFDRYYDYGLQWYEAFFCPREDANRYQAIGEISPQYYEHEMCPERIFTTLPHSKLIIMLRHPVNRAYSHYGFCVQRKNYRGSFEDFLVSRPTALEKGFYSRYLKQYLRYFDRTQILALVFEDAVTDVAKTKKTLADFLGVAEDKFPTSANNSKVNASSVPKFQFFSGLAVKTGRQFRRWHLEPLVDFIRRRGIMRIILKGTPLPPLDQELKKQLSQLYRDEFDELEQCVQIDLSSWRKTENVLRQQD